MTYLVGTKGQGVIAEEIREQLGVKPGWVAVQRLVEDRVEIYFLPPEHSASLKGGLRRFVTAHIPAGEAWEQARRTAWEAATRDKTAEAGQA